MAQTLKEQQANDNVSKQDVSVKPNLKSSESSKAKDQQQDTKSVNARKVHSGSNQTAKPAVIGDATPLQRSLINRRSGRVLRARTSGSEATTPSPAPGCSGELVAAGQVAVHELVARYQPSKAFVAKCRAESKALLNLIRDEFNSDLQKLYTDQTHADLIICVGDEQIQRICHTCIVTSRIYKLYSTLQILKTALTTEKPLIVRDFQQPGSDQIVVAATTTIIPHPPDLKPLGQVSADIFARDDAHKSSTKLKLIVPKELVQPEVLLSLLRRVYLDQDVSDDENALNHLILDWLKLERPDLIKTPKSSSSNRSLDKHRESFRTIRPDFDERPLVSSEQSTHKSATKSEQSDEGSGETTTPQMDEENESTTMYFNESSTPSGKNSSSLTRAETFEMLAGDISGGSPTGASKQQNLIDFQSDTSEVNGSNSNLADEQNSTAASSVASSSAYAPTTRTGLKPKTFTTPVGMRNKKITTTTTASSQAAKDKTSASSKPASTVRRSSNISTTSSQSSSTPKSSSTTAKPASSAAAAAAAATAAAPKASITVCRTASNKPSAAPLSIARAHPISMERSQSPSTSLIRGAPKNFIAANKRLVSQFERKAAPKQAADRSNGTPEATGDVHSELISSADTPSGKSPDLHTSYAAVDSSLIEFESLSSSDLVAHMDKFALISYSRLADALSKLFISCNMADVVITTGGRPRAVPASTDDEATPVALADTKQQIKAHKCILAARSAYFAEQIASNSLPKLQAEPTADLSASNAANDSPALISLDLSSYSYNTVYFSIMHIYTGVVKVPDDVDLDELTGLTHQLHVTTLEQVCVHNLKMDYCHFFHKPCSVCCVGVLKTLPLAWRYDYTDLYSKCLYWIGSHFSSIFCLREFAELKPTDLLEECYTATMSQVTPNNVITKTIECQKLLKNLPRVKWTEPLICMVGRLLEDLCNYVAENYEKILQSETFLNLGKNCWECEVLEENLLAAMNHLRPDTGCKTLIQLDKIECSIESHFDAEASAHVSDSFANLISKMRKYCERYLLKEAAAVVHCSSWRQMNTSLQKRIKDQAILATDFDEPTKQLASKPKLPSMSRVGAGATTQHQQQQLQSPAAAARAISPRSPSNRSTPDNAANQASRIKSPANTYLPPPKNKTAAARHVKVLK